MTRSPGKHLQMPSTPWGKKTPGDSESESGRGGVARAPSTQERSGAGSTRGRSVQGREPSDESRRRALSPDEEGQEEPHGAVRLHQPMGARGKAGSIRREPQGTGPNVNQRGANTQRSLDETDTSFNPGAHAPIRPLFDTDAEQLSLALHQLQCEVHRVAVLHHNTRGGPGFVHHPRPPPGQEQDALRCLRSKCLTENQAEYFNTNFAVVYKIFMTSTIQCEMTFRPYIQQVEGMCLHSTRLMSFQELFCPSRGYIASH